MKAEKQQRAITAFQEFLTTPLETLLQQHLNTDTSTVVALFHYMAATVPAYKTFLREHSINPASV